MVSRSEVGVRNRYRLLMRHKTSSSKGTRRERQNSKDDEVLSPSTPQTTPQYSSPEMQTTEVCTDSVSNISQVPVTYSNQDISGVDIFNDDFDFDTFCFDFEFYFF